MTSRLTNVLGFDTALEQGAVRPENVNFGVGRTPRLALWTGAYCHNAIFAYGDRPEVLFESVRRAARLATTQFKTRLTAKQSDRRPKAQYRESGFRESGQVVFYDLTDDFREAGKRMQRTYRGFSYRQPQSILHLLTDLQEFRLQVQEHYAALPYGAVHRKVTLAFVHLDAESLLTLKNHGKAMQLLTDMFLNGGNERLALLLVVKDAKSIPKKFLETADMAWFLGEENEAVAEEHYELPIYRKHFGLVHIGLVWDKTQPEELRSFCFLVGEKEEWLKEKKSVLKAQDKDWEEYLAALEEERLNG